MARWTDKEPFCDILFFLEHRVKTIFVTARWANLKLIIHPNIYYLFKDIIFSVG